MKPTEQVLSPGSVKVGDGVTQCIGSDRYAGTVTYVSPSGKTIRFTDDKATANGPVHDREQYDYSYESVPEETYERVVGNEEYGFETVVTTNFQTARWSEKRQGFVTKGGRRSLIAGRHHFYDPHF